MFNQNPFYSAMPNYGSMMGGMPGFARGAPMMGGAPNFGRGIASLFGGGSNLGRGAASLVGGATKTGFSWGGFLNGAQKTLGIINQAIPAVQQIKPVWNNAKTMFKVFGEFNKMNKSSTDTGVSNNTSTITPSSTPTTNGSSAPNFFA